MVMRCALAAGLGFTPHVLPAQCPTRARPDSVVTVGHSQVLVSLSAVWRDFLWPLNPGPDTGGETIVALRFVARGSSIINERPMVTGVWLRRQRDWLQLAVDSLHPYDMDSTGITASARRGPHWPVGTEIDIAVAWQVKRAKRCTLFARRPIDQTL